MMIFAALNQVCYHSEPSVKIASKSINKLKISADYILLLQAKKCKQINKFYEVFIIKKCEEFLRQNI